MGSLKSIANTSTCHRGEFHEERTAWGASLLSPRAEGPFEVLAVSTLDHLSSWTCRVPLGRVGQPVRRLGRQCLFGPAVKGLATGQPCHLQQFQKADIPPSSLPRGTRPVGITPTPLRQGQGRHDPLLNSCSFKMLSLSSMFLTEHFG